MWPAFLVLGVGHRRSVKLPLPLFLLWPCFVVAWIVAGLVGLLLWLVRGDRRGGAKLWAALAMMGRLSGMVVDVRSRDGTSVYLRFV